MDKIGLNCGSGQRPFTSTPDFKWINLDIQERWLPDICCNASSIPLEDESLDCFVSHHQHEHAGHGENDQILREAYRLLKPGGSFLIFVPNMRELAKGWLNGRLDTVTYMITVFGAYMGDEADRHKFGYDRDFLMQCLGNVCPWSEIKDFNWRDVGSAALAQDWWILGVEAVK